MVSRNLPHHELAERTRKTQNTHTKVCNPLWGGEVHGHARNTPSLQDGQMHKEDTKHTH